MNPDLEKNNDYDLTGMIVKPLYFGLLINIVIPAALLFVCYYIYNRYMPGNLIQAVSNALFYVLCAVSLAQAGLAIWWRNKKLEAPMVHRRESFEHDVSSALLERSRPIFILIASISVWGVIYFVLTGRFQESAVFVVFSFVVFQVVRPRYGSVSRLIAYQEQLVRDGKFVGGTLADIRKEVSGE